MKRIYILILILSSSLKINGQLPQKIDSDNQIIKHNGYILSYNESCEQANWVFYRLKKTDFNCPNKIKGGYFKEDTSIQTISSNPYDYKYSGYDRGHLKPAGDEPCDTIDRYETYLMSNISPQVPSFNRGIWKKLENYVRLNITKYDSIDIICGGILRDTLGVLTNTHICIPKYFFKVIYFYKDGIKYIECYLLPNMKIDDNIINYKTNISVIEKLSKLKFIIK